MKLTTTQLVVLSMALMGMTEASTSSASWFGGWWSGAADEAREPRVPRITKQARRRAEKVERAAAKEALIKAVQPTMLGGLVGYMLGYEEAKPDFSSLKKVKAVPPKRQRKATARALQTLGRPGRYVNTRAITGRRALEHRLSPMSDLQEINDLFQALSLSRTHDRLQLSRIPERLVDRQLVKDLAKAYTFHVLEAGPRSVVVSRRQPGAGEVDGERVGQLIAEDAESIIDQLVDSLMNVWEGKRPVVESMSEDEETQPEITEVVVTEATEPTEPTTEPTEPATEPFVESLPSDIEVVTKRERKYATRHQSKNLPHSAKLRGNTRWLRHVSKTSRKHAEQDWSEALEETSQANAAGRSSTEETAQGGKQTSTFGDFLPSGLISSSSSD